MAHARAAVDSGTNSTRLLVVDAEGRELTRRTTITRLGRGVDARGHLDDDALERTLATIGDYRDVWEDAGVDAAHVRIAATSAVRDATDRARYFDGVESLTGVRPEVLSGDEEARLSFAGAAGAVDVPGPVAVVDVGGGSTELIVGDTDGRVLAAHSMQVGSVRLTERHLAGDPPTPAEVVAARRMVREVLSATDVLLREAGGDLSAVGSLVGVAGTVTTLGALHAGRASPDDPALHGHRVPAADVRAWAERLLGLTVEQRGAYDAIPPGRVDVIAAGALVLAEVVGHLAVAEVVVSTADILDGLVAAGA